MSTDDTVKMVEMKYARSLSSTWYAALLALPAAATIFSVQIGNVLAASAFTLVGGLVFFSLKAYNALCSTFNELQLMTLLYKASNGTLSELDGLTTTDLGDDNEKDAD